jgi:hypothetical protein
VGATVVKREAIGIMVEGHDLSATRACQVARFSRGRCTTEPEWIGARGIDLSSVL